MAGGDWKVCAYCGDDFYDENGERSCGGAPCRALLKRDEAYESIIEAADTIAKAVAFLTRTGNAPRWKLKVLRAGAHVDCQHGSVAWDITNNRGEGICDYCGALVIQERQ